jgi:hypothetical protein
VTQKCIGDDQVAFLIFTQQGIAAADPKIRARRQLNGLCVERPYLNGFACDVEIIGKPIA